MRTLATVAVAAVFAGGAVAAPVTVVCRGFLLDMNGDQIPRRAATVFAFEFDPPRQTMTTTEDDKRPVAMTQVKITDALASGFTADEFRFELDRVHGTAVVTSTDAVSRQYGLGAVWKGTCAPPAAGKR